MAGHTVVALCAGLLPEEEVEEEEVEEPEPPRQETAEEVLR